MSAYQKILVAIDLGEYSGDLIARALEVSRDPSRVHVVFVHQRLESAFIEAGGPMAPALAEIGSLEDRLRHDLKARLADWAKSSGIPEENTHFLVGKPADLIEEFVVDRGVDLVVIATHARKGLQRLLGSTANAVVQGVKCDVLSVRAS